METPQLAREVVGRTASAKTNRRAASRRFSPQRRSLCSLPQSTVAQRAARLAEALGKRQARESPSHLCITSVYKRARKRPMDGAAPSSPSLAADIGTGGLSIFRSAFAAELGQVRLFLRKREYARMRDERGCTALHYAVYVGAVDVASALLDAGCEVNAVCAKGLSALMIAAQEDASSSAGLVRLLLGAGALPGTRDVLGLTALDYAAQAGRTNAVRALLEAGCSASTPPGAAVSPVYLTAQLGYDASLELLLAAGAPADQASSTGWAPLHAAVYYGHTRAVQALLRFGAALDVLGPGAVTPGQIARARGFGALGRWLESVRARPELAYTRLDDDVVAGVAAKQASPLLVAAREPDGASPAGVSLPDRLVLPPAAALAAHQVHVPGLRRAASAASVLTTVGGGPGSPTSPVARPWGGKTPPRSSLGSPASSNPFDFESDE